MAKKLEMLETVLGSPDGLRVKTYQKGELYTLEDMGQELWDYYLRVKKAQEVEVKPPEEKPEEKSAGKAPEDKSAKPKEDKRRR